MLNISNTKNGDSVSFNQSYASIEKLDSLIKNSFYENSGLRFDTSQLNKSLKSARVFEDSKETIEVRANEQQLKSRIQNLEYENRIYRNNQSEMVSM